MGTWSRLLYASGCIKCGGVTIPGGCRTRARLGLLVCAALALAEFSDHSSSTHEQDTSELVLIIFAAWALVEFKSRVLHWVATNLLMASES